MSAAKAIKLLGKLSKLRRAEMCAHVASRAFGRDCPTARKRYAKYLRLSEQADTVEAQLFSLLETIDENPT